MSAIKILGIDHVVLRVRDLQAALVFYCEGLGCEIERRIDELGLVQLRAGHSLIDLVPIDSRLGKAGGAGAGSEGRNMDHFALALASFDEAALGETLRAAGIEPGEVGIRYGAQGKGPSMYLKDPDGNVVELKGPPSGSA